MEKFSDLMATLEPDPGYPGQTGHYIARPSDIWMQGRSLFGGASSALATRAARLSLPEDQKDRPLRSLLVSFAGPIGAGDVRIEVIPIRVGKSVSVVQATIYSGDTASLVLIATFGAGRETKSVPPIVDFPGEPLDSAPDTPHVPGLMPAFLQTFRIRWTGGGIPGSNAAVRRLGMWAAHKASAPEDRIEEMIAMGDVPPPVMMAHYDRRIKASSLTWSLEFLADPSTIESDWFYLDYHLEAAKSGYSQQAGWVYSEKGDLVAISHQCMTFFE